MIRIYKICEIYQIYLPFSHLKYKMIVLLFSNLGPGKESKSKFYKLRMEREQLYEAYNLLHSLAQVQKYLNLHTVILFDCEVVEERKLLKQYNTI